jgi:hypothetical protein
MNKLLTMVLMACMPLTGFSTCIAIYVATNGHIYVAADTRLTFLLDDEDKNKFETICKIHNVGNTYFAVSGFDDAGLQNAANTALTENIDIDRALKAFCTIMTARYQYRMQQIQQYFPEKLEKFLTDGLGDVCFFGFINGQAKIQEVQFKVRLNKNHLEINYQVQQVAYLAVIGISKDIDNANPDELPDKQTMLGKPAVYVEKLVELEAKKRPFAVSEPIDLLELMPDGATWIKKSKDAVAIE